MQTLPQTKNSFIPREGQQKLIKHLPVIKPGDVLSVQWPTGYGKSIGFAMAWKHCHESGIANRLLLVVANDTQRRQIFNDFPSDCVLVDAPCVGGIWMFERSASDIRAAITKTAEVFVCTVQQLDASMRGGVNTLKDLVCARGTSWMIGFDEFHHYGEDMSWGNAAKAAINWASFSMAMSATPYRRGSDTVFPEPELVVTYACAIMEPAVKPVVCHAYHYGVTVIDEDGEPTNYTTSELLDVMPPEGLDAWEERKNIRYSPQYLHPLIMQPVNRLLEKRATHGKRLQMIVRAMSCSHAKMVCDQVRILAGGLSVDWIGTGYNGRSDQDNVAVISKFCPPKDENGKRPEPQLDILVQVSMAGEGFDSINVAEIVDLYPVSKKAASGKATQDKQFYGRGARLIAGAESVWLHINVPTDHPLHQWAGKNLESWMDSSGYDAIACPGEAREAPKDPDIFTWPDIPKMREIEFLQTIDENSKHFKNFMRLCVERRGYDPEKDVDEVKELFGLAQREIAKDESAQARSQQLGDYLDGAVGRWAYIKAKQMPESNGAVIGRFKKEINAQLKKIFGKSRDEMLPHEKEQAGNWVKNQIESARGLGI